MDHLQPLSNSRKSTLEWHPMHLRLVAHQAVNVTYLFVRMRFTQVVDTRVSESSMEVHVGDQKSLRDVAAHLNQEYVVGGGPFNLLLSKQTFQTPFQ